MITEEETNYDADDDTNDTDESRDRRNRMQNLDSQMADILGELDHIADDPETRIRALGMKLRHMEMQRHHLAALELEEQTKYRMVDAIETMSEGIELWVRQQREVRRAPGHTTISLRAVGVRVEASGKEDDPLFQQLARTIDALSIQTTQLREETIKREMAEREKEQEHIRELQLIQAGSTGSDTCE